MLPLLFILVGITLLISISALVNSGRSNHIANKRLDWLVKALGCQEYYNLESTQFYTGLHQDRDDLNAYIGKMQDKYMK